MLVRSRAGGLEIPAKMIFQNLNKRIIEKIKKKLAPLIRFFKKISFMKFYFFSPDLGAHVN